MMTSPKNSAETTTTSGLSGAATEPKAREPLVPLISPKEFACYSPEEYHEYVKGFYELRQRGSKPKKALPVAEGLRITRTKKGAISIVRRSALRPFAWITQAELEALAAHAEFNVAETWNAFKAKGYIIARTRLEAEKAYANVQSLPW